MKIAVVPARGNSKGVLKKNIRILGNKPLINWTLDFAIESKAFDFIILSTDNYEIVTKSSKFSEHSHHFEKMKENDLFFFEGGFVLHKRKYIHATSEAKTILFVEDIIKKMKLCDDDTLVLLQPTSPFRTHDELLKILEISQNLDFESIISAKIFDSPHPAKSIVIRNGYLDQEKSSLSNLSTPRQLLQEYHVFDGAYYASNVGNVKLNNSFISKNTQIFLRSGPITTNIDNEMDLVLANNLIKLL
ncbi:MAG: N-acylneuraminate cytidylyltransferase [Bacteroidota bacterium]|jgi:CMP-N-acetylneuraminic acid synthetase